MKREALATWSLRAAVAPPAGAWIETSALEFFWRRVWGRPPRGGVD